MICSWLIVDWCDCVLSVLNSVSVYQCDFSFVICFGLALKFRRTERQDRKKNDRLVVS